MAITTFAPVGTWLGHTPLSQGARAALRAFSWLAPADETLHILALTTLFASAAILPTAISIVIGALFGIVSEYVAGALSKKDAPAAAGAAA